MPATIDMAEIVTKAREGVRINDDDALALFDHDDILSLGEAADRARFRIHPQKIVTYIVDTNINYTNVCVTLCKFCAFYRLPKSSEGYVLTKEQLGQKIEETMKKGGIQILLQGGHHPHLKLDWYEDMLKFIKQNYKIHIHGFSPPEIQHFSKINKMAVKDVIVRLKAAGLDTIPGGGAEILSERVRHEVSPLKCGADEWLEVMREAHKLGMKTTATMMYGHVESFAERVEHLRRLRDLQDETGGFTAFIAWSFQPENTEMTEIHQTGGIDYLRTLAVARIYLDNIPNMQSSWVTQGEKIGQMALKYGANDMGSTLFEENVVSAAGAHYRMSESNIRRVIEDLGYIPKRRNCLYEILD